MEISLALLDRYEAVLPIQPDRHRNAHKSREVDTMEQPE
jgi:hypothetical protein